MFNQYANRYFKTQNDVNQVWRDFMSQEDVYQAIERVRGSIAYMSKHAAHKLNGEDMEFMEEPLARLEIGLRKVKNLPDSFKFTNDEWEDIMNSYNELKAKIEKINMQRISWN